MTVRAWRDLRRIRKQLRATPVVASIEGVEDGTLVQLQGAAGIIDGLTLVAPLSKRACVYWEVDLVAVAANGAEARLAEAFDAIAFSVAQTGVDAAGARFRIAASHTEATPIASGVPVGTTPDQEALLRQLGLHDRVWTDAKELRYLEAVVCAGDPVAVIGMVTGGKVAGTDDLPLSVVSR